MFCCYISKENKNKGFGLVLWLLEITSFDFAKDDQWISSAFCLSEREKPVGKAGALPRMTTAVITAVTTVVSWRSPLPLATVGTQTLLQIL